VPARFELPAVLAVVLGILAWMSDKAFTVDDPLFLWMGAHLQQEPLDFFGFDVNWNASQLPMHEVTQNPPGTGYFIAAAAWLLGWSEVALHGAFLVPAAIAAAFTWLLARRLCTHPLEASLISLLTPVFLVSSTNVMCDTSMLALWCASVWCWVTGFDRGQARWGLAASLLAVLAFLTKYYGIALVPLLLAYGVVRERKLGAWCLPMLLPLLVAVGYDRLTAALYGGGQLVEAVGYVGGFREIAQQTLLHRAVVGLAFVGGCLLPALFFAPFVWPRAVWLGGLAACGLGVLAWSRVGALVDVGFQPDPMTAEVFLEQASPRALAAQFLLFTAGGVSAVALAIADWRRRRDADAALLALWVLGTLVFAAFVNWVNNGRSILPVAPALGILLVRRLGARPGGTGRLRAAGLGLAFATGAAIAVAVAHADYRWANGVRDTARMLAARHLGASHRTLFLGNWGWQYYLSQAGATAVDQEHWPRKGDRLLAAYNNSDFRVPPLPWVRLVEQIQVDEPKRLRTMTRYVAGFYAHNVGPLPFGWCPPWPDRYYVWEALNAFRLRPRPLLGISVESDPLAEPQSR
jgi:4-amino-4-deoxy-L-arabinose transferase-like glycosyltransferase